MKFDLSRDFLDGIHVTHPPPQGDKEPQVNANGGLRFLPSSPDGKLHTVIAMFGLAVSGEEQPFMQGGWRFLFTTDEKFEPEKSAGEPFLQQLLMIGATKLLTVMNNLCMHANLPIMPINIAQLVQAAQAQQAAGQEGAPPPAPAPESPAAGPNPDGP
jgi:hypothetical protein